MDAKESVFKRDLQLQMDVEGNNCYPAMRKHGQSEPKQVTCAAMDDEQDHIEDNELKDNELLDDIGYGDWHPPDTSMHSQVLHQRQSQSQGPVIRWERFLPQHCLRVLLVENDDCTRQVVSALLRNCSYEVVAVANGLQAWKLLEDPSNHFDIVLTEVVMPCMSGIVLLTKIMAHNTCKNIPVIMMSSHDSMGIVFKCLSKGAVDFLVKPVRKNELKNLWQHVWRRCHSSSGSGSETGSQTQKAARTDNGAEPENNTGSNDESEDASIGLNVRDGSDIGSGTQGSWTKRAVEVESPQQRSEWEHSHPHCSTIAQVIQPKTGGVRKEWIPLGGFSAEPHTEKSFDNAMGKDLEIAVQGQKNLDLEEQEDKENDEDAEIQQAMAEGGSPSEETAMKAADLIGAIGSRTKSDNLHAEDNLIGRALDSCTQMKHMAFLELSLKRPHPIGKADNGPEDRRILRQSGGSAFTRYNTIGQVSHPIGESFAVTSQLPKGIGSHSFKLASGSLETEKTGSGQVTAQTDRVGSSKGSGGGTSTPVPVTTQLSHSSNAQDLGSSVVGPSGQEHMFTVPKPVNEETMSALNAGNPQIGKPRPMHPGGMLPYDPISRVYQPLYYSAVSPSTWGPEAPTQRNEREPCSNEQLSRMQQTQIHHHHHHVKHVHHHHHHHQGNQHKHTHEGQNHSRQQQQQQQQDEQTTNNIVPATVAPLCGSSNVVGANTPEGNNGGGSGSNGNGNGSVSGSNNASNGQNGSNAHTSTAVTPGGPNAENETVIVVKNMAGGVTGSGGGSALDQNRSAQREAALTKFRQKRKERCFEKKVKIMYVLTRI
eukprot:TRINITY_DN49_c0_g1_i7.p1 TRINITY_DN49_c0_g1~~TRINITY_DN49_c0_g1_i7.p1  ORF type:complete len:822 (-),score=156.41 TRINITY_DN49_c0_g1_i7:877-3342(-)